MTFFELTEQQKKLATIGQRMMDYSEDYGKINGLKAVTDDGLRTLNQLSEVGFQLTHYGALFGTSESNFSDSDKQLISKFLKKEVIIDRKDRN